LDMTDILKPEHIASRLSFVKKSAALNIIEHAQQSIKQLIAKAETLIVDDQQALVIESIQKMEQQETQNLDRLVALSRVNSSIRESEITQLKSKIIDLKSYIERASFKLDAIRVILVND